MPSNRYPIESFGPELLAFLIKCGREKVEIPNIETPRNLENLPKFPTFKRIQRLRARLGMLKARLQADKHPMYAIACKARFQIFWGEKAGWGDAQMIAAGLEPVQTKSYKNGLSRPVGDPPCILVGQPRDAEFTSILSDAGVTLNSQSDESNEPSNPSNELDDFLNSL